MGKAIQDTYSDEVSVCYGCGRLNEHGLQIKSHWEGAEVVCRFQPKPYHTAVQGYVYGGLIASLIDCHSTGAAAAAAYKKAEREPGTKPYLRYVTASLHVDYVRPTPIDTILVVRATVTHFNQRRATVSSQLLADEQLCAVGVVIVAQMPEDWLRRLIAG